MKDIIIKTEDGKIYVTSPYNSVFVQGAKKLDGKWKAPSWVFDARDEQLVRDLCFSTYGTDGNGITDVVTIKVNFSGDRFAHHGPIEVFGRTVALAKNRNSGARLGEGVILLEGGFTSGGSWKNWGTCVDDSGAVVLIRDIPRAAAEKEIAKGATWLTIEQDDRPVDREALFEEKSRLEARIEEIKKILQDG